MSEFYVLYLKAGEDFAGGESSKHFVYQASTCAPATFDALPFCFLRPASHLQDFFLKGSSIVVIFLTHRTSPK